MPVQSQTECVSQDNSHSQPSTQSSSDCPRRRRRGPNELVWTQPRTVPPSMHKNARRISTTPSETGSVSGSKSGALNSGGNSSSSNANRNTTSRRRAGSSAKTHTPLPSRAPQPQQQQQQQQPEQTPSQLQQDGAMGCLMSPQTWKMDSDFLGLTSPDMTDDLLMQNFLQCSMGSSLEDPVDSADASFSQNSLGRDPFQGMHMDPAHFLPSRMSGMDDGTDSDQSSTMVGSSASSTGMCNIFASVSSSPSLAGSSTLQMQMLPDELNGFSAIHIASQYGKLPAIRLLLSICPEDVDLANRDGQTPLHVAATEGQNKVITELLQMGANTLLQDVDGRTALHLAVSRGHIESVRLLLDDGRGQAMIRMTDGSGKTALHLAVLQECLQIVRLLLERGADPRTPVR